MELKDATRHTTLALQDINVGFVSNSGTTIGKEARSENVTLIAGESIETRNSPTVPIKATNKYQNYDPYDYCTSQKLIAGESIETRNSPTVPNKATDKYQNYDPYDYCTSQKPTTYWDAFVHILKSVLGSGIFVMPKAFKEVGYLVGIVGVVFVTIFYTYCTHLLIAAEYQLCKNKRVPNMTYSKTAYAAFRQSWPSQKLLAKIAKCTVNVLFIVLEASSCSCNLIFMAGNVKQLFDHYFQVDYDLRIFMIIVTVPVIFVCWIRTLKSLASFSAAANFVILVCFTGIVFYVFRETPTFDGKEAVGDLTKLPVFFSTVSFSIACIGVVLPLKAEMSNPRQFASTAGVLNMSTIPVSLFYASVGFFGYLKYGKNVADSITLNLPQEEFLCQGIILLFSFPVLISYSLNYYVVLDIVWTTSGPRIKIKYILETSQ